MTGVVPEVNLTV